MALETLIQTRDANNADVRAQSARRVPGYVDARVLAAGTNETHTVPGGADVVFFNGDGPFYAKPNGAAAVPAGDITDGTASELNPGCWSLDGVTSIGLIASATRIVTLS